MELKKQYESIVNKYMELFCKKHEVNFEYWIGGEIGGIVEISDCFFDFNDIRYDIDTNQPEKIIFDWHEERVKTEININYQRYAKKVRLKDLKK